MQARPLIIERQTRTLVVERGSARKFEVSRSPARQLVIERSGLPGKAGQSAAGQLDLISGVTTGQTAFILSQLPSVPAHVRMIINGQRFRQPSFALNGTAVTWGSSFLIEASDEIEFEYPL